MSSTAALIADNLSRIRDRIAEAALAAGRQPSEIQFVGVTKYVSPTIAAELLAAGCEQLGESRPQQLWEKAADPELADATWHMIGHLQRNKVKRTVPLVDLIHSVDSLRLASAINDVAGEIGNPARVLLEINCSGDEAKHGLSAAELEELLPELARLEQLKVCGLMTMAAREGGQQVAVENFASLRVLREKLTGQCPPNIQLTELSMGMSHDFEVAIQEGATIVRVGSSLFEGIPR